MTLQHLAGRGLLLERLLGLVEQAHVLDRDHRLVGEGAQQRDLLVAQRSGVLPHHADGADRRIAAQHRHDRNGARSRWRGSCAGPGQATGPSGRSASGTSISRRSSSATACMYSRVSGIGKRQRIAAACAASALAIAASPYLIAVGQDDRDRGLREQLQPALHDRIEHRLHVGGRAADDLAESPRSPSAARATPWSR